MKSIINFTKLGLIGSGRDNIAPEKKILEIDAALEKSHSIYYYYMIQNFNHIEFILGN